MVARTGKNINIDLLIPDCSRGGVNIKLRLKKGKEAEEGKEEVTVKEIELGDGTRRMLKFEKKEESKEAGKPQEAKKEEAKEAPAQEEKKQEKVEPQVPLAPDIEKRLAKLEVETTKNREMIKEIEGKVENLSKDLDDLVALYEIVSEQMNPFVGLSKVTKQRLEALEKFSEEFESIKSRLEDLEVMVGKLPVEKEGGEKGGFESRTIDEAVESAFSSVMLEEGIDDVIDRFLEEIRNG